ncbi:hypothetical protein M405DRAFT_822785 [Rhizopogon salebrosus TDB-379]|nr:hypothetical protein M405DRAFT_822785 [Rhizopogon salebrosus TDB-379]
MSASPTNSQQSSLSSMSSTTPSSTSTSDGNALNKSSSLLFGFLVSVLSLFGLFMMSGLIWHRLVIRRRMTDDMLRVTAPLQRRELQKPRLWDVLGLSGHGYARWGDTQPLAAEQHKITLPPPQDSPTPRSSFWKRLIDRTPREITYLFSPPSVAQVADPPRPSHPRIELPVDNSHVQVSVLIAMPRPDTLSNSTKNNGLEKHRSFYEVVIGTTDVLYHDSDSSSNSQ